MGIRRDNIGLSDSIGSPGLLLKIKGISKESPGLAGGPEALSEVRHLRFVRISLLLIAAQGFLSKLPIFRNRSTESLGFHLIEKL